MHNYVNMSTILSTEDGYKLFDPYFLTIESSNTYDYRRNQYVSPELLSRILELGEKDLDEIHLSVDLDCADVYSLFLVALDLCTMNNDDYYDGSLKILGHVVDAKFAFVKATFSPKLLEVLQAMMARSCTSQRVYELVASTRPLENERPLTFGPILATSQFPQAHTNPVFFTNQGADSRPVEGKPATIRLAAPSDHRTQTTLQSSVWPLSHVEAIRSAALPSEARAGSELKRETVQQASRVTSSKVVAINTYRIDERGNKILIESTKCNQDAPSHPPSQPAPRALPQLQTASRPEIRYVEPAARESSLNSKMLSILSQVNEKVDLLLSMSNHNISFGMSPIKEEQESEDIDWSLRRERTDVEKLAVRGPFLYTETHDDGFLGSPKAKARSSSPKTKKLPKDQTQNPKPKQKTSRPASPKPKNCAVCPQCFSPRSPQPAPKQKPARNKKLIPLIKDSKADQRSPAESLGVCRKYQESFAYKKTPMKCVSKALKPRQAEATLARYAQAEYRKFREKNESSIGFTTDVSAGSPRSLGSNFK